MIRWPLAIYRVAGHSMQPTYQPGATLIGWRGWRATAISAQVRAGRVVVARVSGLPVVKRVETRSAHAVMLVGDNAAHSRDSRHYGEVPITSVMAVIIIKLS